MRKAAIILPTYNEAKNIKKVIDCIIEVAEDLKKWDIHIIVVDSDSPDNTGTIVEQLYASNKKKYQNLHVIKTKKEGLGKAYFQGFKVAIDTLKPYVLFEMDADLSHNPRAIPKFLTKIEQGADFVIGSRYIPQGSIPQDWGWHRKLFSVLGNWIIRLGYMKMRINDWTSGYRAMKVWIVNKSFPLLKDYTGYVFQVALLNSAIKSSAKIQEIPINFVDRREGISKINSLEYIVQTLIFVFCSSSFVKFGIVGATGFLIDFGISYGLIEMLKMVIWLSTLISTELAITSNFIFNNIWSFKHKKINHEKQNIIVSFLKFNTIASGSILIQTIGLSIAAHIFGVTYWYVYKALIIAFIIIPYSYFFYNRFVWKDK